MVAFAATSPLDFEARGFSNLSTRIAELAREAAVVDRVDERMTSWRPNLNTDNEANTMHDNEIQVAK